MSDKLSSRSSPLKQGSSVRELGIAAPGLCRLIEDSTLNEIYKLITASAGGDEILEHAMSCHNCAARIEQAGEADYARLSIAERRAYRDAAVRILQRE